MAVDVQLQDDTLVARYKPERSAVIAGLGCATVIGAISIFGIVEAVATASIQALLGISCSVFFTLAFAILGLARGVSTIHRQKGVVVNERRFLGVAIRHEAMRYGEVESVVMDVLGRDRRAFVMVSVLGDRRQAQVLTQYDFDEARRFGAQLASFLGVEAIERGDWTPPPPRKRRF